MTSRSALKQFGSYVLLSRLAKGGMGEVFVARHGDLKGMQKLCVVKTLRADMTRDDDYAARFFDEARLVVQLNHRNVCQVFDVGKLGDRFYLGMELVSGIDLRLLIDEAKSRQTGLPEAIALFIAIEMLEALSYAHRLVDPVTGESFRVVHRDVSPQNVMVSFEGEVKLIDFGLAASTLKQQHTQVNRVMGKLAYMSPEQARGDAIDERADIFAAAVVIYELLAGDRYYAGMSHDEVWNVAGRGTYVAPKLAKFHKGLRGVLTQALHPSPTTRTSTAEEFRAALEAYAFARGFRPSPADARAYLAERLPHAKDSHRALLADVADVEFSGETPIEASESLLRAPVIDESMLPRRSAPNDDSAAITNTDAHALGNAPTEVARVGKDFGVDSLIGAPGRPNQTPKRHDGATVVVRSTMTTPDKRVAGGRLIIALGASSVLLFISLAAAIYAVATVENDVSVGKRSDSPVGDAPTGIQFDNHRNIEPITDADAGRARGDGENSGDDHDETFAHLESGSRGIDADVGTTDKKSKSNPKKRRPKANIAVPARTASLDEKLSFLKKHCAQIGCTNTVLSTQRRESWTLQQKFKFDNTVSSCVAVCAP